MSRSFQGSMLRWAAFTATLALAGVAGADGGDAAAGEAVYQRCIGCHALDRNRTGPRHCGVIGRTAGSVPGFDYSKAMRSSGLTWTRDNLDRFLADPMGTVPGTSMGYFGIRDPGDRADLIAYFELASASRELCPPPAG